MRQGLVYLPVKDPSAPLGIGVALQQMELLRLERPDRLVGRYVEVRNGGCIPAESGESPFRRISDVQPDASGDFVFRPGRGGARMDRQGIPRQQCERYEEASHFAEVNAYFHIDRVGHYVGDLLEALGAPQLPRVVAVVNAHNACVRSEGTVDGVQRRGVWVPFQGGHYRLPGNDHDVAEHSALAPTGEIHLGSGRRRLSTGVLSRRVGKSYRHNAGHNAGIIYHEYGHHIHRHTADFRANTLRVPTEQSNRKVSMDEGTCDYWAAVMMGTPHIWAWHRRHDEQFVHRRSLVSAKTMADYDRSDDADPHVNGTIWAASLWDFRERLVMAYAGGGRMADKIVLQALLLIGMIRKPDRAHTCRSRSRFRNGLRELLKADQLVTGGKCEEVLRDVFLARGITTLRPSEVAP